MNKSKGNICVDFDGVLNTYQYYDENELYNPYPGAKEFLEKLSKEYNVIILTARDSTKVEEWMKKHNMPYKEVTNIKKPAVAYIDDRAICFNGSYESMLHKLKKLKPWYQRRMENKSCSNCCKALSCEIGQICTLTNEQLRDRDFEECDDWE